MPRPKTGKKRNVWTDPSPYGTYEGPRGNPDEWAKAWKDVMGETSPDSVQLQDSPYSILGLTISASWEDVQKAFRKLMLVHHPDKGGSKEKCIQILAAFAEIKKTTRH